MVNLTDWLIDKLKIERFIDEVTDYVADNM